MKITHTMPDLLRTLREQADTFEHITRAMRRLADDAVMGLSGGELIERTFEIRRMFLEAMATQVEREQSLEELHAHMMREDKQHTNH